jgi:iron complex outermembrane receptor protein
MEWQHVMQQKRVPDERSGKQDYKAPPPAYSLLNADLSTTVKAGKLPLTVGVSGRNLLNTAYRST